MADNMEEVFPSVVGEKSISYLFSKIRIEPLQLKQLMNQLLFPF
jgi:hypothetical protein